AYIEKHPQKGIKDIQQDLSQLHYLQAADSIEITEDEAQDFNTVVDLITDEQQLRHDRFNDNTIGKSISM
ncbi:TPA: alpha/beta hydrolase, partial [Legionella pneumophila]|nr:alpha/beta hydrolase [Legionella pneumophila]